MTKLSNKIADSLCKKQLIDESDKEIYAFGYEVILDNVLKVLLILGAGALLHRLAATVVFILIFMLLRGYTGGYHAKTKWGCGVASVMLWGLMLIGTEVMSGMLLAHKIVIIIMVTASELIIYQYAPVEHINKRLTKEKKSTNRKYALILSVTLGILILLLTFQLIKLGVVMAFTVLEVAILMIIPSEGRACYEKTDFSENC